jgi:hypothetical protein
MTSQEYVRGNHPSFISEVTNQGVFSSTTVPSNLGHESSHRQGSVMSELEHSVLLHEETCVNRSPSSCVVQSPETTADGFGFRPGDDRCAPRRRSPGNIRFLQR